MPSSTGPAVDDAPGNLDLPDRTLHSHAFIGVDYDLEPGHYAGLGVGGGDATNEVLNRRFSETRRPHPYGPDLAIFEAIRAEREALLEVKSLADMVLDTSQFSVHELKAEIIRRFELPGDERLDKRCHLCRGRHA